MGGQNHLGTRTRLTIPTPVQFPHTLVLDRVPEGTCPRKRNRTISVNGIPLLSPLFRSAFSAHLFFVTAYLRQHLIECKEARL